MKKKNKKGCFVFVLWFFLIFAFIDLFNGDDKKDIEQETSYTETKQEEKVETDYVEPKKEEKVEMYLDIKTIVSKDEQSVNSILGNPITKDDSIFYKFETGEPFNGVFTNVYETKHNEIEIMFIENKAARITITFKEESYFIDYKNVLFGLGFDVPNPEFENEMCKRWNNFSNIYEIGAFKLFDTDKLHYIHIISEERYK